MNPKLDHSTIYCLAIPEVAEGEPVQANPDPRACLLVLQGLKPLSERLPASGALVVAKFHHWEQCNLYITTLSRNAFTWPFWKACSSTTRPQRKLIPGGTPKALSGAWTFQLTALRRSSGRVPPYP